MVDRRPVFLILSLAVISFAIACQSGGSPDAVNASAPRTSIAVADNFAYPIGPDKIITEAKDAKDEWFNALDFGEDNHLGEDWNKNSGGNTDCGQPVYASGNGEITYASDAGPGWGNVVMITHTLADGRKVQSLYGHMQEILKITGEIKKREQIGKIGNANGRYLCHLHFEIREESSPMWNQAGPGYSTDRTGSLDPSDFLDQYLK
jgi:murein DD-endopeptidase MepM/ murein hydrolase activator NlpD